MTNLKKNFGVLLYDSDILSAPKKQINMRYYDYKGDLKVYGSNVTNNLGMLSKEDYFFDDISEDDLVIAVLGGEQTASTTRNISWPDLLKKNW